MKKIYILITALCLLTSCSNNISNKVLPDTISFFVASDTHLYHPEIIENKELFDYIALNEGDGRLLNYAPEIFEAFLQEVLAAKPEYLILTGDLTLEGEKVSHEWIAKQLEQIKDAGIQTLVIPGNHDILNPGARTYGDPSQYISTVSAEEFAEIYTDYGYGTALYRDENSLSYVYPLRDNAWILMIDTARYEENNSLGSESTGSIREGTYEWIEEISAIAQDKNIQLISTTHHNIIKQNEYFDSDNVLLNTLKALRIYGENDIRVNFSGHIHAQNIRQKEKESTLITDICSSSLLVSPNQYGTVSYKPFDELVYTTQPIDMKHWAINNSIEDENLLNFTQYSFDYFKFSSTSRGAGRYTGSSYTNEQIEQLIEAKGTLNSYYFAGRIDEIKDDFMTSDFYTWLIEQDESTKGYILAMLNTNTNNPNQITIDMTIPN